MSTELQARSQAENWMRYILSGQLRNLNSMFQPEKQAALPYAEYRLVYQELEAAIAHLENAQAHIIMKQMERKTS